MHADWTAPQNTTLRVDVGLSPNPFAIQFLADILGAPVDRPANLETSALGAAYLAGLATSLCPEPEAFAKTWRAEASFSPQMDAATRAAKYSGWTDAIRRTLTRQGFSDGLNTQKGGVFPAFPVR